MRRIRARALLGGVLALAAAVLSAWLVALIHSANAGNAERAVALTGMLDLVLLALCPAMVVMRKRRGATAVDVALAILVGASVLLAGTYLYWASSVLFLRADTLIWSEGLFVGDILKLRIGYPLFTAPANLESTFYPPLTQVLTYALAKLVGQATSIPAYRVIQLLFSGAAALVGTWTVPGILELARPGREIARPMAWGAFWTGLLFLCATNAITNPFAHMLHDDALSVLICAIAFALLIEYAATRSIAVLVMLAVLPAVGFYVKQSLAIWGALVSGYLAVFDRPRDLRRAALYAAGAGALGLAAYLAGGVILGPYFHYWTITDLANHPISVLRGVQHLLTSWAYFAAGIAGALLLVRRPMLAGAWIVWLLLISQETYTSGIAWMLNHLGPGSLIAGIWLAAAVAAVATGDVPLGRGAADWRLAAGATILLLLSYSGLGFVRIPIPALPDDVHRYVAAIEREFQGMDPRTVLLDAGTWTYVPAGVVPKDRSALVGDLGASGVGDFTGLLERIRTHAYRRILVHSYHSPQFGYDYYLWPRSSGIRAALTANYREVRTIPAVAGQENGTPYLREISVLEPAP